MSSWYDPVCIMDTLMTFTCPREVSIVHYKLGIILWTLRAVLLFYVIWSMVTSYTYLEVHC